MASEASPRGSLCDGDGGLTRTLNSTVRTAPHLGKRCLSAQSINWRLKRGTLQPYQESRTAPPSIVPFPLLRDALGKCHFQQQLPICRASRPGSAAGKARRHCCPAVLCPVYHAAVRQDLQGVLCMCVASRTCEPRFAPDACTRLLLHGYGVSSHLPSLAWFLVRAAVTSRDVGETPKQHQH